jgi:hypothetical protein
LFEWNDATETFSGITGKVCIKCNEWKPVAQYSKHAGHRDGLDGRCNPCRNEHTILRNKLRSSAPPKTLTCECCGKTYDESRHICLDHCHVTNTFRGWICTQCNTGIGSLGDNEEGLLKALDYLRKATLKT